MSRTLHFGRFGKNEKSKKDVTNFTTLNTISGYSFKEFIWNLPTTGFEPMRANPTDIFLQQRPGDQLKHSSLRYLLVAGSS